MDQPEAGLAAIYAALDGLAGVEVEGQDGPATGCFETLTAAVQSAMEWSCAACEDDLAMATDAMLVRLRDLGDADAARAAREDLRADADLCAQAVGVDPAAVTAAAQAEAQPSEADADTAAAASPGAPAAAQAEASPEWLLAADFAEEAETLLRPLCAAAGTGGFLQQHHGEVLDATRTVAGLAGLLGLGALEALAAALRDGLTEGAVAADPALWGEDGVVRAALEALRTATAAFGAQLGELPAGATLVAPEVDPALTARVEALTRASKHPGPAAVAGGGESRRGSMRRDNIRVESMRLDRLLDTVGELVITESMLRRSTEIEFGHSNNDELGRQLTRMGKITRELQELSGSLRMVPVRATFRKMSRLAKDVAKKSGKRVDFVVHGEEAELDKSLVDQVGDPLVHLVRNAIDHGLELTEEERVAAGKPPLGRVELRALHRGSSIHIEVQDDGRGLDADRIRRKAIERGLVGASEQLSPSAIYGLICRPGFSTAEAVTSISGRGVGMDVVKQNIQAMGGTLEIRSTPGQGSCFSMQLPLTLAVIDGLVVRLGSQRYIIPTLSVVRLVRDDERASYSVFQRGRVIKVEDQLVPVVEAAAAFGGQPTGAQPGGAREGRVVVIVEADGQHVAFEVDALLGQQQCVVKSLGEGLGPLSGISGCAIMDDGLVGLVMDVNGLLAISAQSERGAA